MTDKIVKDVIQLFKQRSAIGIKKYGTTLEQNNTDDFIQHLQEELMDAVLYLQKIKDLSNSKIPNISDEIIEDNAILNWMKSDYDYLDEYRDGWINAIKWYRKQIYKK